MKLKMAGKWYYELGLVTFILYILTFYPIFNLHLVGDNYVTVGIFEKYLHTHPGGIKTYLNYIFSDWGIQDTLEYLFYRIYGFSPYPRYIFSFIIRFLAGLSFVALVYYFTKNKLAAYFSAAFFLLTAVGIQATDWSVNSISFVSVILINLFLISYIKLLGSWSTRDLTLSAVLFTLAIIIQPVRTIFLPLVIIVFEFYLMFTGRRSTLGLKRVGIYIFIFLILISFTHIGNAVVSSENIHWIENVGGSKFSLNNDFFTNIQNSVGEKGPSVFLTPIAQLAAVTFGLNNSLSMNLLEPGEYLIWGLASLLLVYFLYRQADKKLKNYVVLSFLLVITSIIPFWLKNPEFVYPMQHRYMIVPAAGLAMLLGLVIAVFGKKYHWIFAGAVLLILVNAFLSYKYLTYIESVRSVALTQKLRESVYAPDNLMRSNETILYYFEPEGSDTLLYSLLWGFNYIVGYQNGISNIWDGDKWNFAATDNWDSVISAYTTGEFFTLFEIPAKPVKLDNVFSYKIKEGELVDTTGITRKKLRVYDERYASNY